MQAIADETEVKIDESSAGTVDAPVEVPLPKVTSVQRGRNLVKDIKREMPDFSPTVIFDVGANIGECAKEYATEFPDCRVYCFEPVATTFVDLEKNLRTFMNAQCFPIGFGDEPEIVNMISNLTHPNRSYVMPADDRPVVDASSAAIIQVKLETLDRFCLDAGIEHIDLLKIDTEGFDMKVLSGAQGMLAKQGINFIVVEAGMYAGNTHHVPFMDLCLYLEGFGFVLFGIYDQCREWTLDLPYLRRADLAFIRKEI
jgi:FkbM family methyltransferase